jgi:hypothetical protein
MAEATTYLSISTVNANGLILQSKDIKCQVGLKSKIQSFVAYKKCI